MALDGIVRMVDAFFRHCLRWLMQQPVVAAGAAGARGTAHRGKYRLFDFSLSDEEMRRISRCENGTSASPPEWAPKWDVETVD
jgi:diketogulonate reductase-like aldo/keto reductase